MIFDDPLHAAIGAGQSVFFCRHVYGFLMSNGIFCAGPMEFTIPNRQILNSTPCIRQECGHRHVGNCHLFVLRARILRWGILC